jgi:hypothetical protein
MPMDSVTEENVERLNNERGNKEVELETIKSTSINKMWLNELEKLSQEYIAYKDERTRLMNGEDTKQKKKVVSKSSAKKVVKKQILVVEDD